MPRKPKYLDAEKVINEFFNAVSESYRHPILEEEVGDIPGRKKQELVAAEFGISRLKVRKILITTGDIKVSETLRIQKLIEEKKNPAEVMKLSRSTINSYLPYNKGVYKLVDVSAVADRIKLYRKRQEAVKNLRDTVENYLSASVFSSAASSSMDVRTLVSFSELSLLLWNVVVQFEKYPFVTGGRDGKRGAKFKYMLSRGGGSGGRHYDGASVVGYGNELFINGREKVISRSSLDYALKIVLKTKKQGGEISGLKQLKIFGASYVYAVFQRFGIID